MLLILARHGKAAHNVAFERHLRGEPEGVYGHPSLYPDDVALSAEGRAQAAVAGAFLRSRGPAPDVADVSPTRRTRETWAAYSLPEVPAVSEPRLREQEGGAFDFLPLDETEAERRQYADQSRRDPDARPPHGESIREHLTRLLSWLDEVQGQKKGVVAAVTHYGSIGLLGMHLERLPLERYLAERPDHLIPAHGQVIGYRCAKGRWGVRQLFAWTESAGVRCRVSKAAVSAHS